VAATLRPPRARAPLALAAAGLALAALPLVALAVDPVLAPAAAGVVLMVAGFGVMAPCEAQMAAMLAHVVGRLAEQRGAALGPSAVRHTALRFAAGYLLFYVPVAVALGAGAVLLGSAAWVLVLVGAAAAAVLGLAALGRVRPRWLERCRGPLYLLRSGRASFARPVRAGVAFGRYCATCCGPYVFALAVLAGGTRSFWVASGLVLAYAVLMAVPFLGPALLAPATYERLGAEAGRLGPALGRATGVALVALGVVLVPVGIALA
jgi:cytochrome c biogenesis protein CcdA